MIQISLTITNNIKIDLQNFDRKMLDDLVKLVQITQQIFSQLFKVGKLPEKF